MSTYIPYKVKVLQPAHKHFDRGFLETEIFGYPYFCRNIVASKDKSGLLYVFLLMPIILNIRKKKRENPAGCALLRGVQGFLESNLKFNITNVNLLFPFTANCFVIVQFPAFHAE